MTTSRSSARQKDAIALLKEDHQKVRGLFAAKAKVIKDRIEHHAEEEETEMFPKARKAIGARGLRELGAQMKARKEELKSDLGDSR